MKISFSFFYLLLPCWECRCKSNHIFLPSLSFSKNRKPKKNIMIFRKPLVKALAEAHHTGEESQLILLVLDRVFILGTSIPVFFSLFQKSDVILCFFFLFCFFSFSMLYTWALQLSSKSYQPSVQLLVLLDGSFVCLPLPCRYFVFMGMSRA